MDTEKPLTKIFLSASIPSPDRNKIYFDTADIIAIRDAIKALATVIIPKCHLIWGGHPSITPLIRYVLERMNSKVQSHVTLYQTLFYEDGFPEDNFSFENVILTPRFDTSKESLEYMRARMIQDNDFRVGIFIGGMEGINDEYEMFSKAHPSALVLPIASTGAAADLLFQKTKNSNMRLKNDFAYQSLFSELLADFIKF